MLMWRAGVPNIQFQIPFCVRTLIKHLPSSKPNTFCPHRTRSKTLTTTRSLNSSHFETLNSRQQEQIRLYVDALLQWNQKMNLTAVKEVNEVMERHIEDSLAIIPPIRDSYTTHCDTSCINNLKLIDVGSGAGLPGLILAIACPAEYCLPLVRVGGLFVAAKGHNPREEVKNAERAVQLMGASLLQLCSVKSQSPFGQRTAVVCLKSRRTPKKYPRDPGTPAKMPL